MNSLNNYFVIELLSPGVINELILRTNHLGPNSLMRFIIQNLIQIAFCCNGFPDSKIATKVCSKPQLKSNCIFFFRAFSPCQCLQNYIGTSAFADVSNLIADVEAFFA